jgi:hypothetical protein
MINSNYWKWLYAWDNYYANYDNYEAEVGLVNIEGNAQNMAVGYDGGNLPPSAKNRYFPYDLSAKFGSGTGQLSPNDYTIADDISSSITSISVTSTSSGTAEGFHRTIVITGRNASEQAVTIKQVGITKYIYTGGSQGTQNHVLMGAFNLASPITVQPNDQFMINVDWANV